MEWIRLQYDGMYQIIGSTDDDDTIETGLDVTDGKCRELWIRIKEKFPRVNGYRDFCKAYREGKREWEEYCERDARRYRKYWGIGR